MALKYCDYIADVIKKSLCADEGLVSEVGHIQMDLHPEEGYFVSTKKTIPVKKGDTWFCYSISHPKKDAQFLSLVSNS